MKSNIFNSRRTTEYSEGQTAFRPGQAMSYSNALCPYPIGSGNSRIAWMTGWFDGYFQNVCDRNGLGRWSE